MTSDCAVGQWTFVSRLPIMKKINYLGESTLVPLELKSTINLRRTGFPMKANLPQNEPKIMARWEQMKIYERIREVRKGAPVYVLHDGPPYANGPIHLGTAMNKCLKDFIVKSKCMSGFDSPYVPGWDCHGLPIEIKVDQQLGGKKMRMRPVDVRAECRKYAEKYLNLQRQQFKRIAVFGGWDEPYSTMTPQYESAVVAELYAFLEKESVYKGLRSVYWCIHDETALAEAEVEYENHTSPTVWVKYPLRDDPAKLDPGLREKKVFTVIWTTTPWTLPASMAVAFHPDEKYVALESESEGEVYIVAEKLAAEFSNRAGLAATHKLAHFPGKKLEYLNFAHPFLDRAILGVVADYVTMDTGTGVVHTAPSHGAEDFATGVKYKLDLTGNVDEKGIMRNGLPEYDGKQVFAANEPIVELLKKPGVLMHAERVEHSYPHCWRCHNPVIFRSTEQWFISMETPLEGGTLRSRTLDEIKKVKWDPAWGEERISNMIATRPDWCISRQRVWGVPIAVFLCEGCGKPLNDPALNRKVIDFFGRFGPMPGIRPKPTHLPLEPSAPNVAERNSAKRPISSTSGSNPVPATSLCSGMSRICPGQPTFISRALINTAAGFTLPCSVRSALKVVRRTAWSQLTDGRSTSTAAPCPSRAVMMSIRWTSPTVSAARLCVCGLHPWTSARMSSAPKKSCSRLRKTIARFGTIYSVMC